MVSALVIFPHNLDIQDRIGNNNHGQHQTLLGRVRVGTSKAAIRSPRRSPPVTLLPTSTMRKPRLLLCFDAFGTLFRPKKPVSTQYADIARGCGLSGFSDDDVARSFKDAFKEETRLNPNYGRATGLGATNWWTNVSLSLWVCSFNSDLEILTLTGHPSDFHASRESRAQSAPESGTCASAQIRFKRGLYLRAGPRQIHPSTQVTRVLVAFLGCCDWRAHEFRRSGPWDPFLLRPEGQPFALWHREWIIHSQWRP